MDGEAPYGAAPAAWDHWRATVGAADLLPVFSAIGYRISRNSSLTTLGKSPSMLNREGEVVGLAKWTARESSDEDVRRWKADGRLGLCVQTRRVRALDLDIGDAGEIRAIEAAIFAALDELLPVRRRANSAKCLLVFRCEGYLGKRTFRTHNGMVEFLGNGQQFVAEGAHWSSKPNEPSGARYDWPGGRPTEVPEITPAQFEALWTALYKQFGIDGTATGGADRERRRAEAFDAFDGVAEYLIDKGLAVDQGRDGAIYVDCPWASEHTTDSGPTASAWFPAGTGGYERGHYRCLHAHCEGRSDTDFTNAIGYDLAQFEALPDPEPVPDGLGGEVLPPQPLPAFVRDGNGRIEPTIPNYIVACSRPDITGLEIAFDEASHSVMVRASAGEAWRPIGDVDITNVRASMERRGFKPTGKEGVRDAIDAWADANRFDSFKDWLRSLAWDGVPRIETFLSDYLGTEDRAYTRAVARYWWTALAGRLLEPGLQCDMAPILHGLQGEGKTQFLKAMLPTADAYVEINLSDDDDKLARLMRGKLLGEIAELRGLRSRDADSIKAWVTRQWEEWVPKYKEHRTRYARRLVFAGTTNDDEFLDDPTGERRWLPFACTRVDIERVAQTREQLWAEARALFETEGLQWRAARDLAKAEHAQWKVRDAWHSTIAQWIADNPDMNWCTSEMALCGALGADVRKITRGDQMRAGKVLHALGATRQNMRFGDKVLKVYALRVGVEATCGDLC